MAILRLKKKKDYIYAELHITTHNTLST